MQVHARAAARPRDPNAHKIDVSSTGLAALAPATPAGIVAPHPGVGVEEGAVAPVPACDPRGPLQKPSGDVERPVCVSVQKDICETRLDRCS